jgi:ribosomal protein S18 acetylase RimI-like enzyme
MATPVIRKAEIGDAEALSSLARRTFDETFSPTNSEENMRVYMDAHFFPARQREEIADPLRSIYIAWHGAKAVGFLSLYEGEPEVCIKTRPTIELSRIYVDSAWHGTGLARELTDLAFSIARKKGCSSIWLGVWEHNLRALKFYYKMGFMRVGSHVFMMGNDPQNDFVLECPLE